MRKQNIIILTVLASLLFPRIGGVHAGEIITSVPAIASIIENVTDEKPDILTRDRTAACVHDTHLKPTDIMGIARAELIVIVSRDFEPYYNVLMKFKDKRTPVIELATLKGMLILPARHGKMWPEHHHSHDGEYRNDDREEHASHDDEHDERRHQNENKGHHIGEHEDHEGHEHHHGDANDYHLWLDPDNAVRIAEAVTDAASRIHPDQTDFYRQNYNRFAERVNEMVKNGRATVAEKTGRRYMVSHDSIQYLEHFFNLSGVGAISDLESGEISIKKALSVEREIKENNVQLLLIAGNTYPQSLGRLKKENTLEVKNIDILGTSLPMGKDLYFQMMTNILNAVCR